MYIKVKVIPRARKTTVIELESGMLKVKVSSPPADNRANQELVRILADYYGVKRSAVKIRKGEKSREKLVEILSAG
ncbi:MAG TPA: DUF167 domain-containing protein [candidate division WOR-3 bacterium]|uniref:UPF0235 protein ENI34_09055 n=1 Tax=candidate division WOR-3 bacterium TaxID=2052148 RepID=A0A9C9ENC2_UNCW3|nr:DUF167 domain-containing protein [candidate division WOR-3 bacterium]